MCTHSCFQHLSTIFNHSVKGQFQNVFEGVWCAQHIEAKDLQGRFEVARAYRQHVDQVGKDRSLEEFLQAQTMTMTKPFSGGLGSLLTFSKPWQSRWYRVWMRQIPKLLPWFAMPITFQRRGAESTRISSRLLGHPCCALVAFYDLLASHLWLLWMRSMTLVGIWYGIQFLFLWNEGFA